MWDKTLSKQEKKQSDRQVKRDNPIAKTFVLWQGGHFLSQRYDILIPSIHQSLRILYSIGEYKMKNNRPGLSALNNSRHLSFQSLLYPIEKNKMKKKETGINNSSYRSFLSLLYSIEMYKMKKKETGIFRDKQQQVPVLPT